MIKPWLVDGRWIIVLVPQGLPRFIAAVGLLACAGGWATGEWLASHSLSQMLPHLDITHGTMREGHIEVLGFTAAWAIAWTLGGLWVGYHLLRGVIGEDRIEYDATGVRRLAFLGRFQASRVIPRDQIQGVSLTVRGLVARTSRGRVLLSRFGTRRELTEVMLDLRQQLHLDGGATDATGATPDHPPDGWDVEPAAEGAIILRARRGALNPIRREYRLGLARVESCVGVGSHLTWDRLDNPDLAIESWSDSDGDRIYRLVVRHAGGRHEVAQVIDDPFDLVQLGRWMSRRIERPLELPAELKERFAA